MSNRILLDSVGMPGVESEPDSGAQSRKALVGKKIKGKRKKAVVKKPTSSVPEPAHHYRLNLADIPFVAGKVILLTLLTRRTIIWWKELQIEFQDLVLQISRARFCPTFLSDSGMA